ncbi:MAG: hypothetical protein IJF76_04780 [Clostridia bacterium]|nr:hypothetical protein [Clostridia bacterium]
MYKFYLVVALVIVCTLVPFGQNLEDICVECGGLEYAFYVVGEVEEGCAEIIENGGEKIVRCAVSDTNIVRNSIKGRIRGESFRCFGDMDVVEFILNRTSAKVVKEGYVDGIYTAYLYTGEIKDRGIELFGEKVNMQIAINQGVVSVGTPIILGSY